MVITNQLERHAGWFRTRAINYVDEQIAIMEKYGSAPVLSPEEYYSLVAVAEEVGKKLWRRYGGTVPSFW